MGVTIPSVIAAILLPPLGVFLRHGLGQWFWIAVALTILGWIPGVIFALVILFRPPRQISATS
jgi:uncharacterized membrane protein YqaE (UPF0057 family)